MHASRDSVRHLLFLWGPEFSFAFSFSLQVVKKRIDVGLCEQFNLLEYGDVDVKLNLKKIKTLLNFTASK